MGAQWTVEATRRGSMTLSDQADACVTSPTTPLDSHDRRGPVCASPGIGSFLKRRPTRLAACGRPWTLLRFQPCAWLMPDAMARCTPPPAHVACRCIPVPTLAPLAVPTERSVRCVRTKSVVIAVKQGCSLPPCLNSTSYLPVFMYRRSAGEVSATGAHTARACGAAHPAPRARTQR